ncbi:MAG TPA: hypothetical protein VNA87_02365 [Actinomycetota bacterium]|nr:hypothetical protein [Actinomycetota bacterium]
MSDRNQEIAGGRAGHLAGRVKEAVGQAVGSETLATEGRLQKASVEAEASAEQLVEEAELARELSEIAEAKADTEAERLRLQNELTAKEREELVDQDRQRVEENARMLAEQQMKNAESARHIESAVADLKEDRALDERSAAAREAALMKQEARRAEREADTIDPEVSL